MYVEGTPKDDGTLSTPLNLSARDLFEFCFKDDLHIPRAGVLLIDYSYIALYQLHIFDIFCAVTFIYIKPRQDILTGCSKLGDLLKVSVFQVYKNKVLQ